MESASGVHCQDIFYILGHNFPPGKEGATPLKEVGGHGICRWSEVQNPAGVMHNSLGREPQD
jgi:hypothetical protein